MNILLGASYYFVKVPIGVTHFTLITISSKLPYLFFFIPEALVATHPPTVENSIES